MIVKFGRHTIQRLCSIEHQKIVRNSAKIISRRERKSEIALESARKDDDNDDLDNTKSIRTSKYPFSVRSKSKSGHSILSLKKHGRHVKTLNELLASSDDGTVSCKTYNSHHAAKSLTKGSVRSNQTKLCPKSLVEELESVRDTAGLCKRSTKRNLYGNSNDDTDDDDDDYYHYPIQHPSSSRSVKVRFADSQSVRSCKNRTQPDGKSDLWLVEDPQLDEVLDLSDPRSLARHTAFAPDTVTARAMVRALRDNQTPLTDRGQLVSEKIINKPRLDVPFPFPIVDGKILIDEHSMGDSGMFRNGAEFCATDRNNDLDWNLSDNENMTDSFKQNVQSNQNKKTLANIHRVAKIKIPGREYASNKARGDMKRSGLPEPFAFIPLGTGLTTNSQTKNKTNRITAIERKRLLKQVGLGKQKRKRIQISREKSIPSSTIRGQHKTSTIRSKLKNRK